MACLGGESVRFHEGQWGFGLGERHGGRGQGGAGAWLGRQRGDLTAGDGERVGVFHGCGWTGEAC